MITALRSQTEPVTESGIELLEEMLSIPSPSTQERALGQWLVSRLRAMGFAARRDEVGNVVAFWGSGPREVLLMGHIDTVPGFIPVRREGDRLSGRGAVDAKGPLAAAITAVARQPAGAACRFTVIGAVEEEGSSRGARHLTSRRAPDQLIILEPSGWDAVTLGYKGSLKLRYRLSQPMGHGAGPNDSAADKAIAFVRRVQDHAAGAGLSQRHPRRRRHPTVQDEDRNLRHEHPGTRLGLPDAGLRPGRFEARSHSPGGNRARRVRTRRRGPDRGPQPARWIIV